MTFLKNLRNLSSEMSLKVHHFVEMKKKLFKEVIEKFENFEKTNYDLGLYHLQKGNLGDALIRFKIVNLMQNSFENQFQLIRTYILKKEFKTAKILLDKLNIEKNNFSENDEKKLKNIQEIVYNQKVANGTMEEFADIDFLN